MLDAPKEEPRVLLIYPPGPTARGMEDALRDAGIACDRYENVFRAVTSFASRPTDLVVLGLGGLRERDLDILAPLRDIRPGVFVLLAFPGASRELAVKALASGADAYLLEPFYMGEFVDLVKRGLERARRPEQDSEPGDPERLAVAVAETINNRLQILELLLADLRGGDTGPEEVQDETRRIKDVTEELLAFARKQDFEPLRLDLNRLVEKLAATHPALAGAKLGWIEDQLPRIEGDPRGLTSMITALAGMAGDGSRVEIATGVDDEGCAQLIVWAPDLLLEPGQAETFFRPFESPARGATGVAAATAKAVVEAHGASASVVSREGSGTAVTIRFPSVEGSES